MTERTKLNTPEAVTAWLTTINKEYTKEAIEAYYRFFGPETWWQLRERERIKAEKLKVPDWVAAQNEPRFEEFFIYAAVEDNMKIAYTPSVEYGRQDRKVVTTVGRFLMEYFKDKWTEAQIKAIADEHRAEFGPPILEFLFDADSIQEAYIKGTQSCMSHATLGEKHEHPTRIYDSPDTVLAIIRAGGKVTARSVCNIGKSPMQYTRLYGDAPLLKKRLEAFGFRDGTLEGARFRVAKHGNSLIMPYLDSCPKLRYAAGAEFATADMRGNIECKVAAGLIPLPAAPDATCDCCGAQVYRRDMGQLWRGEHQPAGLACQNCMNDRIKLQYAYVTGRRTMWVPAKDVVFVPALDTYVLNVPQAFADKGLILCKHDGVYRLKEDVVFVPSRDSYYVRRSVCRPRDGGGAVFMKSDCIPVGSDWVLKDKLKEAA